MKLIAEFNTDRDGKPLSIASGGLEHYSVALKVKDAPPNVRQVTYHLHPTYRDSARTVSSRVTDFEEPTTSYGDYDLTLEYEVDGQVQTITRKLSEALSDGLGEKATEACRMALNEIKKH